MAKKQHTHGRLYEHAKAELELAGLTGGKGKLDQTVYHTVLKLVDTFEQNATTELLANTIGNLFATLSQGEIINSPTNDPEEWKFMKELEGGVHILERCSAFRSRDGGETWYRFDTGATGVSINVQVELTKEDENASSKEEQENVQPPKS